MRLIKTVKASPHAKFYSLSSGNEQFYTSLNEVFATQTSANICNMLQYNCLG